MGLKNIFLSVLVAFFSASAWAKKDALIDYKDGAATPQLAKSINKVKDGEYLFELDLSKKIKGKAYTVKNVKDTLEGRMKKKYGVAVDDAGGGKVKVSYTGDEQAFLRKLSKTRIKTAKKVTLAFDESVSDGGMRASSEIPPAAAGEVKGLVIKSKGNIITIRVTDSKFDGVRSGKMKIKSSSAIKKGKTVIFKPKAGSGKIWQIVEGSLKVY